MPYSSVDDIPQSVKDRVKSAKKRRQWLHVWNSAYDAHKDESRAFAEANAVVKKAAGMTTDDKNFSFFLPIAKVDKEKRTVSGYASTDTLDSDGEIISREAMKAALPGYWQYRNIREMHRPSAVGTAQEASLDTKGLFLSAKIVDEAAWQKCVEGVYKGFSIGGRKLAKNGNTVTKVDLFEISVVDRPANPDCKFAVQKSAKNGAEAYLLPVPKPTGKNQAAALKKMAEVVDILTDESESDPDSEAVEKRDFDASERKTDAKSGAALPDGSFPIENTSDLANARHAVGRAKDKGKARTHIRERAKELGVKLPKDWGKKMAKGLIAKAEKRIAKTTKVHNELTKSASPPSFLTLDAGGGAEAALGKAESGSGPLDISLRGGSSVTLEGLLPSTILSKREKKVLTKGINLSLSREEPEIMAEKVDKTGEADALTKFIAGLMGKAVAAPANSAVGLLKSAGEQLSKAKDMRKEAAKAVESAFNLRKKAYLAKKALSKADKTKKPELDSDGDYDNDEEVMKLLRKAYAALTAQKTFVKAAGESMKKAEGCVEEGVGGVYEVPDGIKTISPSEMDNLAANKAGFISREHAEALVKAAAASAEAELLKSMPAVDGKKPYSFDMSKLGLVAGEETNPVAEFFKGANPASLSSNDPGIRETEVAKSIGNRILGSAGKTIFDPAFHGTAGG